MKLLRNDDIIIVDGKLYQFQAVHDNHHCNGCAFNTGYIVMPCKFLHCTGETRIDQLTGHFKKI